MSLYHKKLTKCHVLFLGNSVPEEYSKGLEALQQPLIKCYPIDHPTEVEGIDSWLTVFTSGVLLQLIGSKHDHPPVIWFPIQNLFVAAATKCVNFINSHGQKKETRFMDINSAEAKLSSHPPLFSIIVRKSEGRKILQCYTFLVKDEEPAMMMVDATKHAFLNKSGWVNEAPPDQVVKRELMPLHESDDIDEFDSVSASGRQNRNDQSDEADEPKQTYSTDNNPLTFPSHLVRKYTLTYSKRSPTRPPTRNPIPDAFMPRYERHASVRSSRHDRYTRGPPIPAQMFGSLRGTVSSVRYDPQTRTSIIEKVIREPVPLPVPVYQPPPPPKVIREVRPVYVPQMPEVRHIPVEVETHVPIPVPMPYPPYDDQGNPMFVPPKHKHSHRSKRHKQKDYPTFRSYQVFDGDFARKSKNGNNVFTTNMDISGSFYHDQYNQNRYQGEYRNRADSSGSSSGGEQPNDVRMRSSYSYKNGAVKITELDSYEPGIMRADVNGNHDKRYSRRLRGIEDGTRDLELNDPRAGHASEYVKGEFNWAQTPYHKNDRKHKKLKERASREVRPADIEQPIYDRPPTPDYDPYRPDDQDNNRKDKRKEKKKSKTPSGQERISSFVVDDVGSKDYFFKRHTEAPPRNWMDDDKEYMNERAFSRSVVQDGKRPETDAYALNHTDADDTILDRNLGAPGIPAPPPLSGIPVPPPLPKDNVIPSTSQQQDATLY